MNNQILFDNYIIIKQGQVIDSSNLELVDNVIHFTESLQYHIILDMTNMNMNLIYDIDPIIKVDIVETRLFNETVFNREINVGENSQVNIFIENIGDTSQVKDTGHIQRDAYVQLGYCELENKNTDSEYKYDLDGENADLRLRMATLSLYKKNYKVHIKHNAINTTGIMDNYGVVRDEGHLTIDGIGTITKGQRGSASHQTNKIMVFDEKCYASANPYLFIDEYDVQASHAAGVGKMDENHLYYLESRGLTKTQSMQLITYGYLRPVVDIIDNDVLKERFEASLSKVGA